MVNHDASALIVDDSATTRRIVGEQLKSLGFHVEHAEHGKQGLSVFATMKQPKVVVVDWNMPEMDGLEFIKQLRARADGKSVLIMMATTVVELPRVKLALEAGANEYMMKPFSPEDLEAKLRIHGVCRSL